MSKPGHTLSDAIRPAISADLGAMARIHATSGTPGLLSDLGEAFLHDVYYRGLLASPVGVARVIEIGGEVVGFVTYSPDSGRLFGDIFRRRTWTTFLAVARASLRKPRVCIDFVQTVLNVERSGSDIAAEVVSLEVAPAFQGLGLGLVLLERAVEDLKASAAGPVKARILADHRVVERLYLHFGFRQHAPFRLHGRSWVLMVLDDAN
jgi:GNAT superfamily N-acetyltransferase